MKLQLRVGTPPKHYIQIRNDSSPYSIKPYDGVWTSTFICPHFGSDWVQWCIEVRINGETGRLWNCYFVRPNIDTRIYTINKYFDLAYLIGKFPLWYDRFNRWGLDFEGVAKEYDAIHLTKEGVMTTRFSQPYDLSGWDCESVLWLNAAYDCSETIPAHYQFEAEPYE